MSIRITHPEWACYAELTEIDGDEVICRFSHPDGQLIRWKLTEVEIEGVMRPPPVSTYLWTRDDWQVAFGLASTWPRRESVRSTLV